MPDTFDPRELLASAYVCSSSTDQLMLGMAGHVQVAGVFITCDGVPIVYHPLDPRGVWQPMGGSMGWSAAATVPCTGLGV